MSKPAPFLILLLLLLPLSVTGQSVVSGRVSVEGDPEADGVTVLAMDPADSTVLAFTMTSPGGLYELKVRSTLPELLLSAFRMDTERQVRRVPNETRREDFSLKAQAYDLKEVLVTAPTVYRKGDTISYVVSKLTHESDQAISDVLARVPGMRVKKGGRLEYLGKSVETVMIEGIDLSQGSYALITENVKPKDISSVEILRSFQKIRALQDKKHSDEVAVNLKLKDKSKGIWTTTLDLAAGYGDGFRSRDKGTAQYFTKQRQHLLVGYFDNTGHPDADRYVFGRQRGDGLSPVVSGTYGAPSDIPEESYLDNTTAYVSQSSAIVPSDSAQLKLQSHYTYNLLRNRSDRITSYIDPPLELIESTSLRDRHHEAKVEGDYELNKQAVYLQDHLTLSYLDRREPGSIVTGEEATTERLDHFRTGGATNTLRYVRSDVRLPYEAYLDLRYHRAEEQYDATPYGRDPLRQELSRDRLYGHGSIFLTHIPLPKGWHYTPGLLLDYSMERLEDRTSDPLRSSLRTTDIRLRQMVDRRVRKFYSMVSMEGGYLDLSLSDDGSRGMHRWYLTPSFSYEWKPTFRWKADGGISYGQRTPDLLQLYPGELLLDYRTSIDTKAVEPYLDHSLAASSRITYSDVFHLFSAFLRGRYATSRSSYLSDFDVTEEQTIIRPTYAPHRWYRIGGDLQLSKGVGWKGLNAILDLSLDRTETEVMSGGVRIPYVSTSLRSQLKVSLAPVRQLTIEYRLRPQVTWSAYGADSDYRSLLLRQELHCGWSITPKLYLSTDLEQSILRHKDTRGDNLVLAAEISYKLSRKCSLELSGSNLLGATDYTTITYTDFGQLISRYPLRPRTLLLGCRVSF